MSRAKLFLPLELDVPSAALPRVKVQKKKGFFRKFYKKRLKK